MANVLVREIDERDLELLKQHARSHPDGHFKPS